MSLVFAIIFPVIKWVGILYALEHIILPRLRPKLLLSTPNTELIAWVWGLLGAATFLASGLTFSLAVLCSVALLHYHGRRLPSTPPMIQLRPLFSRLTNQQNGIVNNLFPFRRPPRVRPTPPPPPPPRKIKGL